jgi:adenylate cyclase
LGRYIRYWYTYRTTVAMLMALVLSGAMLWLYNQQLTCDAHRPGCLLNVSVHPEDRLFVNQVDPGPGVVIVGIDDRSIHGRQFPLPRHLYADALRNLERAGALAVGIDVQFTEQTPDDAELATALASTTVPVVLAYGGSDTEVGDGRLIQKGIDQRPLKQFWCRDADADPSTPCARPMPNVVFGSTDLLLDQDGVVRRVPFFVQPACYASGACGTPIIDSFGLAAYRASLPDFQSEPEPMEANGVARFGDAWEASVDSAGLALINFSGPPGNFPDYKHYASFADVVAGTADPAMFKDSIVLIGAYNLSGVNDEKLVTTSAASNGTKPMAGVEIHANVVQMLLGAVPLRGNPSKLLSPEPEWVLAAIVVVLALIAAIGVARVTVLWGLAGTAVALVGFTLAMAALASFDNFVPDLFHPWLAIALTYSGVTAYRFLYEDREKRKVTNLFGHYLKPEIVAELAKTRGGADDILRGGERRDITLMFVDIRGFTSMSESMAASDVTEVVQMYLDHLSGIIFTWDGTIDKYVGDEIMAFWNAPRLQDNHALLAVRCAYDCINRAGELQQKLLARGLPPIRWGIGINSGPAVVGNMGSHSRLQYTALGDTVNTAARFCAHAPAFQVLIGQQTYEMCREYIAVDLVPGVQLKGKSAETFRIYDVTAIRQTPDSPWVAFPTQLATQSHHTFTAQYTQQTVLAAGDSGSTDLLVGNEAEELLAKKPRSPN